MTIKKVQAHLTVSGQVQGVGYRQFTLLRARENGVNGWVKNKLNGEVTALLEGEEEAVRRVINDCLRGPNRAVVKHLDVVIAEELEHFEQFTIRY